MRQDSILELLFDQPKDSVFPIFITRDIILFDLVDYSLVVGMQVESVDQLYSFDWTCIGMHSKEV